MTTPRNAGASAPTTPSIPAINPALLASVNDTRHEGEEPITLEPPDRIATPSAEPIEASVPGEDAGGAVARRKAEAERFLSLLDEEADAFTFQTFDDLDGRKSANLAGIRHATLESAWAWLDAMNQAGAGVFVTVCETNGKGRKIGDITRVRAVFADFDPPKTAAAPEQYPLPPVWQVESSPGKRHAYWSVDGLALDEFKPTQKAIIAALGSDPAPNDLPRVMRLPGFFHMKNPAAPHLVTLIDVDGRLPYTPDQITAAFSKAAPSKPKPGEEAPRDGQPDYLADLLTGDNIHDSARAITGRMVAFGRTDEEIRARFSEWAIQVSAARGADRASALMGDELERMIQGARGRGWAPPPLLDFSALTHPDDEPGPEDEIDSDPAALTIEQAKALARKTMREFSALHAVVMIQGRAVIVYREVDADTGRHVTRYSGVGDIALKFKPLKIPIIKERNGQPVIEWTALFPLWLESKYRTTYQQLVFKPVAGLVAGPVTLPKTKSLNLYQGLTFAPVKGDCERIKEHIQAVWCDGDPTPYNYVMDWLARMFQIPQERGHTVIVLRSGEGTGKNITIDPLVRAFGEHALVAVKADGLVGRFNDDLATSVLVFANEAVWGGDKALEGALKSLITDEELPVERKYIPKFRVTNCVHLMMASNNDWVAPIGLDDRRFVVLDVSEARKGDHAYFAKLVNEIENGGREAFIHELLERDIRKFNPRILPEMKGHQSTKFDAKVRGADSVTQWWIDCLYEGEITATVERESMGQYGARMVRANEDLANGWTGEVDVSRDTLYSAYVEWANRLKRRCEAKTSFGKKLTTLAGIRTVQKGNDKTGRTRVYVIPPLDAARAALDAILKQRGPWHDEEPEAQS
jgi:hypothetical protein